MEVCGCSFVVVNFISTKTHYCLLLLSLFGTRNCCINRWDTKEYIYTSLVMYVREKERERERERVYRGNLLASVVDTNPLLSLCRL